MDREDRLRDVVVVGSGPAGMGALLTGAFGVAAGRLNRVMLEASPVSGGQARMASRIEGVPYSPIMGVTWRRGLFRKRSASEPIASSTHA